MESAKKRRTPVRRRITKLIQDSEAELGKAEPSEDKLVCLMESLMEVKEKICAIDNEVLNALLDADEDAEIIEGETDSTAEYEDKMRLCTVQIKKCMKKIHVEESKSSSSYETGQDGLTSKKRQFKLPKIELKKFNGEITGWLSWWAQFQKIHDDGDLHASDKFQYLVQGMKEGTRARDLVESYPQTASNYPKVILALQERFGKEKLLTQVYVRELLKMVINNAKCKEKVKLSKMFDKLESHLRALESLKVSGDQMAKFLYPMVESSIPEETLVAWQRSPMYEHDGSQETPPRSELDYLIQFLKKEVEREEERTFAKSGFELSHDERKKVDVDKSNKRKNDVATAASLFSRQEEGCIFCGRSNHASQDCYKAARMSMDEKNLKIKETKSCFACLRKGHQSKSCKSSIQCHFCNRKHHPVMCPIKNGDRGGGQSTWNNQVAATTPPQVEQTSTNSNQGCQNKIILMKTLHVMVSGKNGVKKEVRLLFDEGSQRSYIKTKTAQELNCQVVEEFTQQNSLFGGYVTDKKSKTCYRVKTSGIAGRKGPEVDLKLVNEDFICGSCPIIPFGPWIKQLAHKKIYLTDTYAESPEVEILIGSDLWGSLMTGKMVKLENGLIAVESVFGWTVSGVVPGVQNESNYAGVVISMLSSDETSLPKLWDLETIGIKDSVEKITQEEHDQRVRKQVQEGMSLDKDGRYVVSLPWINESTQIPNNKIVAEKRLLRVTEKLKQQGKFDIYDKIFKDWEQEGIVESVCVEENSSGHFLPHRPVFKTDSLTTPVRPVFDASCRVGRNPSLNQCLEKGPNWLELIPAILLRFREKRIGVVSDIRKAFQMIGVAKKDRNYQKFLWWEDIEKKTLKVLRHCRVMFGLNCSPFLLAAVLEFHLDHVPVEEKKTAELIKKSLYVDNCVLSVDTNEEYLEFKEKSTEILARGKMDLRQWECSFMEGPQELTNVLGLKWDKKKDTLSCKVNADSDNNQAVTKRIVLSSVSQIFDPIGFTCPALLPAKKMLQESWATELGWDTAWCNEKSHLFRMWREQLPALERIAIPRNVFGTLRRYIQLHTFCDASNDAYAAVVFVRVEEDGNVYVQLLSAKTRLVPLDKKKKKTMTIPRAELMGCVIAVRLYRGVVKALALEEVESYFWSDSTTALAWIKRDQDWGTFVGNRVREVNKLSRPEEWRHVPGVINPADLPSRGCSPSELLKSRWWEGPEWLKEAKESWPGHEEVVDEEEVLKEVKKTSITMTTAAIDLQEPRFSSYYKNVRVAGWVRRFITNLKTKKSDRICVEYLDMLELRQAEVDIIRQIQTRHYPENPQVKNLKIVMALNGILTVQTRLAYREDTEQFKNPMLLPNRDHMVDQLIEAIHLSHCHAGAQFVLGKLREKVWIVQGRKAVNRVIHKCIVCRRHAAKPMTCDPSPLPAKRIEANYMFQTTGVDLAGPIMLKGGKKCWIVLYTCAVYRGVYLDIVDSLSSEEFLDSLEKFTQNIGRPTTMFSDNGTNFVGAQNLMKKLDWKKIQSKFGVNRLQWTFNPPTAAWWGGWWERLVRTIKDLLRRMIGTAKLTRKELEKCLASISYCINNRPLTTLTEDAEDLKPLTPAMFMRDLPVSGLPERDLICSKDLQGAFVKIRDLKNALQERFRKEYLALLVAKGSEKNSHPPKVGDVVLVGHDNKKRYQWPLGRIMELCPGRDGKIRVARVKTTNGVLLRPLQRLYPLELSSSEMKETGQPLEEAKSTTVPIEDKELEVRTVKTRRGREIKLPIRYGQWNQ